MPFGYEMPTCKVLEPVFQQAGISSPNGTLMLQPVFVDKYIAATQLDVLMHITGSASGAASFSLVAGLYTTIGSTANLISSASNRWTYQSTSAQSYTNHSGTRYRSFGIGTWVITPGVYLLGILCATTSASTNSTVSWFGKSQLSVAAATTGGGNYSSYWGNGVYNAATSSMPASIHLSALNQTNAQANMAPWFRFIGTF